MKNRKALKISLSIILYFLFTLLPLSNLHAGGESAGTVFLKSPNGRPAGMGEACSSIPGNILGISSIHYNPASSGFLKLSEFSLMGQRGVLEDNFGSLMFGVPTSAGTFSGYFLYYSMGEIDLITSDGLSKSVKAQEDLAFTFNYGREWFENVSFGANLKILRSKLVESLSSTAFAGDFGIQAKISEVFAGLSVQNAGTKLKYVDVEESLPLTFRGGLSRNFPLGDFGALLTAADLVKEKGEKFKEFIGLEFSFAKQFALRTGYKFGQEKGKINFGVGFSVAGIQLDYALANMGDLGMAHTASIGYKFGESQ